MSGISVVIPCRDGARFLAPTLRSALNQTLPPDEVIVVDDGSADESRAIAESFGPPVRVVASPGRGASAARNAGAALCGGNYVMFLDADDLLTPPTLAALAAELGDAERPRVALCPWQRLEREGEAWMVRPRTAELQRSRQDVLAAWLTGSWSPPCAVLWTRAAIRWTGAWDERLTVDEDGEYICRALARGVEAVRTQEGLSLYRRVPGSVSSRRTEPEGLRSRCAALEQILGELERAGCASRYRAPWIEAASELVEAAHGVPEVARRMAAQVRRIGGTTIGLASLRRTRRLAAQLRAGVTDRCRPIRRTSPERLRAEPAALTRGPLVSVVIPTYNRAKLVYRSATSVLDQSYLDLELIVVDDGSTDDTLARLTAIRDLRLRVISQENGGVAAARNRGMAEAAGVYIAFLDSDDLWQQDKLARQIATLEAADRRYGFCYTGVELRGADVPPRHEAPIGEGRLFEAMLLENPVRAPTSCGVIRREVYEAVGGFDPSLPAIEDWEWLQRVARLYDVLAVDAPLTIYREEEARPVDDSRRSRDFRANLAARDMLWHRNRDALRRCGLSHLYLIESARRELREPEGDPAAGRRLVLRALYERPQYRANWPWLFYMLQPAPCREWLRRLDALRHARQTAAG